MQTARANALHRRCTEVVLEMSEGQSFGLVIEDLPEAVVYDEGRYYPTAQEAQVSEGQSFGLAIAFYRKFIRMAWSDMSMDEKSAWDGSLSLKTTLRVDPETVLIFFPNGTIITECAFHQFDIFNVGDYCWELEGHS